MRPALPRDNQPTKILSKCRAGVRRRCPTGGLKLRPGDHRMLETEQASDSSGSLLFVTDGAICLKRRRYSCLHCIPNCIQPLPQAKDCWPPNRMNRTSLCAGPERGCCLVTLTYAHAWPTDVERATLVRRRSRAMRAIHQTLDNETRILANPVSRSCSIRRATFATPRLNSSILRRRRTH